MGFDEWLKKTTKAERIERKKFFFDAPIYEQWFNALRLSERYLKTCENGGGGDLDELYKDFGDIRNISFKDWFFDLKSEYNPPHWKDYDVKPAPRSLRAIYLFAERTSMRPRRMNKGEVVGDREICIAFPRDVLLRSSISGVTAILKAEGIVKGPGSLKGGKRISSALYPVSIANPNVPAIRQALEVFKLHGKTNPATGKKYKLAEIAKAIGMRDSYDLSIKVSKLAKRGKGYVEAAEKGKFPVLPTQRKRRSR